MAFASVGQFLGASAKAAAPSSVNFNTANANLTAGRLGIIGVAKDNASSTDGQTSEVTSITDAAGNTWAKLGEYCNGQGGAALGATDSVWYTIATSNLGSGSTVTINFSSGTTAKAAVGWVFTLGSGSTISISGTGVVTAADDGVAASSMSFSGLSSQERLYIRFIAAEAPTSGYGSYTQTSGFTIIPVSGTGGGAANGNMCACGEFKIATSTGETSAPSTDAADHASVFLAIEEIAAATAHNLLLLGVGT